MEHISSAREDEIHNAIYQRYFRSWEQWLHQDLEPDKRHERIGDIATVIFNNFLDKGYYLQIDKNTLFNKILVWAYALDKQFYLYSCPELTMNGPQHRDLQKDRENYEKIFETASYWNYMRSWADKDLFATLHASSYFWANLPFFVYRFIDMENSRYVKQYDDEDKQIEDEEVASLIEQGVLFMDKKGRLISASLRDTYDE